MAVSSSLLPSGVPTVDAAWGGMSPDGSYLLVGRSGAGRSALALQVAGAAVDAGGRALIISPRAPEVLADLGAAAGFDLRAVHATGRLRLLRVPAAADLAARGNDGLDQAYRDLAALVAAERPDRVVVEDLTPLVQFESFDRFRAAFAGLADGLRAAGVALVVGLGEPANAASDHLLAVVRDLVDGTVTIEVDGEGRRLALHHRDHPAGAATAAEPEPDQEDDFPAETARPETAEPTEEAAPMPYPADPAGPGQSSDGSSVATDLPVPTEAHAPLAHVAPLHPAPAAPGSDGLPRTRIVPPPDVDPSLLEPAGDPFGQDPAASMFEQGYLVDSGANGVVGFVPSSAEPPAPYAPAPAFAPIGTAPPSAPADPAAEVRRALDDAFAARASGTPFLVVAVRMEPSVPESAHFFAIADGLRRALRPEDRLLVDLPRRRAVVVLPGVGAEGAGALFSGLQTHLRTALGTEAEGVLRAVGAVSVPDGQPFTSTADLLAYAYES
ncbi:MAG TPA: ATPase domain-containing protein [Rubricoccaceae bacterium]|jgi:hypothetical protein